MCDSVVVRRGQEIVGEADNIGELRAFGLSIPDDQGDDFCLCSFDWERLSKDNRVICRQATQAEGWPFPAMIVEL